MDARDLDPSQPVLYERRQTQRAVDVALHSQHRELDATFRQHDALELERLAVLKAQIAALSTRLDEATRERTWLGEHVAHDATLAVHEVRRWAEAMFTEQERAREVASDEREKSANALREGLSRSISEGDNRLHEHVTNQFVQINSSLISAGLLEVERIDLVKVEIVNLDQKVAGLFEEKQKALDAALTSQKEAVLKAEIATDRIAARAQTDQEGLRADMQERLAAVRRELEQATAAQKEAVLKAEAANQRVFEGQDEWRSESADRERSAQEALSKLTATYMPREVATTQFNELRNQLATVQLAQSGSTGQHEGERESLRMRDAAALRLTGFITIALGIIGLVTGVLIGTHAFGN